MSPYCEGARTRVHTRAHARSSEVQGRSLASVSSQGPWGLYNELPALQVYLSHFLIKPIQPGPDGSVSVSVSDILLNIAFDSKRENARENMASDLHDDRKIHEL